MSKRLWMFIKPYWKTLSFVLVMSILSSAFFIIQPLIGKFIIDEVFIKRTYPLFNAVMLSVTIIAITVIISLLTRFIYMRTSLKLMLDMRTYFYRYLLNIRLTFFHHKRVGDIISRINEDIAEIQRLYSDSMLQLINLIFTFGFSFILLLYLDWKMTLFCFILVPFLIWTTYRFRTLLLKEQLILRDLSAKQHSFLIETLSSLKFIRSTSLEASLNDHYEKRLDKMNRQSIRLTLIESVAQGIPQFILFTSTVVIIIVLGMKVLNDLYSLGTLLAFSAYLAQCYSSVQGFAQLYLRFQRGKASIKRVQHFFDEPLEEDGEANMPQFQIAIEWKSVSFQFGEKKVIDNIQLTINKGEKIAIIGESGSGKSTFVNLLARVYKPTAGSILIDGIDVQSIKRSEWHKDVCVVAHDFPIWHGTIRDYLLLGIEDVNEAKIEAVLEKVGFYNQDFAHTNILERELGEGGITLSAGQRQRLMLARALLLQPEILILDEATSHLDTQTEKELFEVISRELADKTIILITHRLENLDWLSKVFVMSKGNFTVKEVNVENEQALLAK